MKLLERVAVALDTGDRAAFARWCAFFGPRVGVLKVGLQAFTLWGPAAVEEARRHCGSVFLDLKLHDIPTTVASAVRAARALGASYLTLHAGGGPEMLGAAVAAAGSEVRLLAVTLLTHLDAAALAALELPGTSAKRVAGWTELASAAGCSGVVCSPQEAESLRAGHPRPFLLVTPGIRGPGEAPDDQRRTASAAAALAAGADLLVVGRPLTRAADPAAALQALAAAIGEGTR